MVDRPKPYTSGELMRMAVELIPLDPLRVVATYANEDNWTRVHADQRCYWSWIGPVIVGYELADSAFRFGHRHVAPPEPVTLTAEEREAIRESIWDAEIEYEKEPPDGDYSYRDVAIDATVGWLAANGFALVRTGGAADGA